MKLNSGEYFGNTVRQRNVGGLLLTFSKYIPNQAQPRHVHANPTMYVLLAGHKREQSRQAEFEQRPLTAVFHPTSEPHASLVGPQGTLGLNLEYGPAWMQGQELQKSDLGGYQVLDSVWTRLAVLRVLAISSQVGPDSDVELESSALELLAPLVKKQFGRESLVSPHWFRRAEEVIHDSFRSPLRLAAVAREVGVHPIHLARVFRRRYGCSVGEYLGALRLAEAGRLILQHSRTIGEAACAAGFADHAHLCRCFSRRFGFSPKRLRAIATGLQA
jgi:AraC family transcriptional regulator